MSSVRSRPAPPMRNPQGLSCVCAIRRIVASAAALRFGDSATRKDCCVGVEMVRKVIRKRVCVELLGSAPVLFDIVKRRFVRTSWSQDHDLSQGTLNPLHMMGLPNRALEPISRSWSFCANDIEASPAQDFAQATISSRSRLCDDPSDRV